MTQSSGSGDIPLIDMSDFDDPAARAEISAKVHEACISVGFFLLKGHGISREVRDNIEAASRRYFALPKEELMNDLVDDRFRRGYMPAEGVRSTLETYEMSLDLPLDDPDVQAGHFLHGPNIWPKSHPWLREATEPYLNAVLELGEKLERLFALGLGLDEDYFVKLCKKPTFHLRLMHNMPVAQDSGELLLTVGEHSDFGMLTILMPDAKGGLQIRPRNDDWIDAPYVDDAFVINVGDMLELWTNDLYVSTPHRVKGLPGRDRFSIPAFFSPAFETVVECIPGCLAEGEKPKFAPLKAGEYLARRLLAETEEDGGGYAPVGGHREPAY